MLPLALSEVLLERGERDLEPDVPAEAKAVRDGLRGRGELHLHAVDHSRLDAILQGPPLARTTSSVGVVTFGMRIAVDEHPHRVRRLARHTVDLQGAEQADGPCGTRLLTSARKLSSVTGAFASR